MPFSVDELVRALEWWWASPRSKALVWGGPKMQPPMKPTGSFPRGEGPSLRWWCAQHAVGHDNPGFAFLNARRSPAAAERVLSGLVGPRVWYVLHPNENRAAYQAALEEIRASGLTVPKWLVL